MRTGSEVPRLGLGHAVVLGGSMAGLLAARALAPHFGRVTVLEQDVLPGGPEVRKGVPQARHAHALLGRGAAVLESFFPGLTADLLAHGALEVDPAADSRWYQGGVLKCRFESDMRVLGVSRWLLEWRTREHLLKSDRVRLRDGVRARGLVADASARRIIGVALTTREGAEEHLEADLVVDATGRGSRTPRWLEALGLTGLPTSVITSDVGYASRLYRRPAPAPSWKYLMQIPQAPDKRVGVILPVEGERWMVTLAGFHGDHPPADEPGFLAYARSLAHPDLHQALQGAEPLSDIATYRIPSSVRRHYERMAHFPEGLAVLGDAACCFNPTFAQGVTTAALGAATLRDSLEAQARGGRGLEGLSRRFQAALARVTKLPWQVVASEDFRYPETTGPKAPGAAVMNWYLGRVHQLCAWDPDTMRRFMGVMHMLDPPRVLFHPRTVLEVLFARSASAPAPGPEGAAAPRMDGAGSLLSPGGRAGCGHEGPPR